MKLVLITLLAALSLSLLACEEKKDDAAKPMASGAAAMTAKATAAPAAAKPSGSGW